MNVYIHKTDAIYAIEGTLHCILHLMALAFNGYCLSAICTLQSAWFCGLARRGERRQCFVKFYVCLFLKVLLVSRIVSDSKFRDTAIHGYYERTPRLTTHALYYRQPSLAIWASNCLAAASIWPYCADGR